MSKSNLPRSSTASGLAPAPKPPPESPASSSPIAAALRRSGATPAPAKADVGDDGAGLRPRGGFYTWFAATVRWLHIYVSLLGFTALLFFAVTGITLNHPTWFGGDHQVLTEFQGQMRTEWLQPLTAVANPPVGDASGEAAPAEITPSEIVVFDRLSVVEHLRSAHRLRGAVAEFRTDDEQCMILFKGPAYAADVYVNRQTGQYTGTLTTMGVVALINDLHKGRDSGAVWSWVIDISALLMVFVSITGLILIFYLKRKRNSGVLTAVGGTVLFALLYFCCVP